MKIYISLAVLNAIAAGELEACTSEKIFARAVADECVPLDDHSTTLDWTAVTGEIFEARTLLFIHGPWAAEVQLQNLLSLVLHSYSLAAQCPAAIVTASYSLAEARAALEPAWQLEKNRSFGLKQLALLQLSLAMYPLAAHEECTQWPLRGRELTAAFLRLGQKLFQPQGVNKPQQRLSVALVSACAGLHTQEMRSSAQRMFGHYADKHGYDLHFFMDAMDVLRNLEMNITSSNSPAFWRAYALRSVLERFTNYDWFLWLDCDVIITDVTQTVESILASHATSELPMMLISADRWGIQPDLILLRGGDFLAWSKEFLQNWTALPSKQFLHAASRVPPETRHPERVALQHASLPHWHTWLEGSSGFSWESFTWNPRIQLAMQVVQDSLDDVATGHLERADATLPTFALKDLHCRGRAGLSEECRWRREQNFRRIKQ